MSTRKTVTLDQALVIARAGGTALTSAARRVDGIPAFGMLTASDGGLLGQAYRDIESDLPGDRDFTVDDWIEATHERIETDNAADVWQARVIVSKRKRRQQLYSVTIMGHVETITASSLDDALDYGIRCARAIEYVCDCRIVVSVVGPKGAELEKTIRITKPEAGS